MSKIKNIVAREILASGGTPTVEVEVELESGIIAEASVSYGASAGSHEAKVILDGGKRYGGLGMLTAVANVNEKIAPFLVGKEVGKQKEIDKMMIDLDGSENKGNLGANAILGLSMVVARAGAMEEKMPLFRYLRKLYGIEDSRWLLPQPMMVMIEGGKHADDTTDLQEYLAMPYGVNSARDGVETLEELYLSLKKVLKEKGLSINVGNEGALAPNGVENNEKPLEYLTLAAEQVGLTPGEDVVWGIDAAASEFFDSKNKKYNLTKEGKCLTSDELIEYYLKWLDKYPVVTIEDMLDEEDWEGWVKLTTKIKEGRLNIGDDLTVTNKERWRRAMEIRAANAILIKLNQVGTVTETMECGMLARDNNKPTIVSHRGGGETNDTFMVDLAVALGSQYIKCGPTRGERVTKYNRLMRIEEELNSVTS